MSFASSSGASRSDLDRDEEEYKKADGDVSTTTTATTYNDDSTGANNKAEQQSTQHQHHHHITKEQREHHENGDLPFALQHDLEKNAAVIAAGGGSGDALATAEEEKAAAAAVETEEQQKASASAAAAVPNGGLRAWLQVLASFFMFFNTWGIVNAFGIYQTYYESGKLFTSTPSNISWIGSVQGCLLMLVSSLAGPIYDAGYVRSLVAVGSFLIVFGQMMLSLCTTYWQVFLAQGICVGMGTGCLFVTGVAILSTYFSTRLATATGAAAMGSSIGGMIYPIIFDKLLPKIGFAWATRVLGFVALGTLVVANVCTKVRVVPSSRRKMLHLAAFKEAPYTFFTLGSFIGFAGLYCVFFYVQSYAIQSGIMGPGLAFYLLTILNASSTFGRFLPNLIADKVGPLNVITPCVFLTALLTFCLAAATNVASIVILVVLLGFFSGTFVSLPPTIIVHLSLKHRHLIGTRMGMAFAVTAIGLVFGPPVAGAIQRSTDSFTYVWVLAGCFLLLAGCSVLTARVTQGGWSLRTKV